MSQKNTSERADEIRMKHRLAPEPPVSVLARALINRNGVAVLDVGDAETASDVLAALGGASAEVLTVADATARKLLSTYAGLGITPYVGMRVVQTDQVVGGYPSIEWCLADTDVTADISWFSRVLTNPETGQPIKSNAATNFVFEGDSITVGTPHGGLSAGDDYPTKAMLLPQCVGGIKYNVAASSQGLVTIAAQYAAEVYPKRPAGAITRAVLSLLVGTNDWFPTGSGYPVVAATWLDAWESYISAAKADGFEVIAYTIPTSGAGLSGNTDQDQSIRRAINDGIRQSVTPNYLIDLDALIPDMTTAGTWSADGLHPNALAHTRIARAINDVLGGVHDASMRGVLRQTEIVSKAQGDAQWLSDRYWALSMASALWSKPTPTGSASVLAANQHGLAMSTGATTGSSALAKSDGGGWGFIGNLHGQVKGQIYWGIRFRVTFRFYVITANTNVVRRIQIGTQYNETTVGDLSVPGIGLKIENLAVKVQAFTGVTLTLSAALATIAESVHETWTLDSLGNGKILVYRGGIYVGTALGGPTANGTGNGTEVAVSVANGAGTANGYLVVSGIKGIVGN